MKVDIIRMNYGNDDSVGGAVTTGTTVYCDLPSVLTPRRPSQQSLEAGLETDDIYDFTCAGKFYRNKVTIFERDEILVTWPLDHDLYNLRLRVTGMQPGRGRRRYAPIHCTLSRLKTSRSRQ
jgi:hypothetical protein